MINFLLENKDLTAEQELQCLICIGIDVIKEQFTFIKNWNEVTAFTFKHPNFNYVNKLSITKITPDLITLNFNEKSARSLILSGVMLNKIVEIIKPCIESKYQEQLMRASLQSNKEKLEQEKIKVNALVKEAEKEIVLKKLFHEIKVALKVFYGNKCFFCNIKLV